MGSNVGTSHEAIKSGEEGKCRGIIRRDTAGTGSEKKNKKIRRGKLKKSND